jgi:hypothetical protein
VWPYGCQLVGTVSALQLLGALIINLYSEAKGLVQGGKCEVFYSGSVGPP